MVFYLKESGSTWKRKWLKVLKYILLNHGSIERVFHKTAVFRAEFRRGEAAEEEIEYGWLRSEQGSGITESEKPETSEQIQELEEDELIKNVILDK